MSLNYIKTDFKVISDRKTLKIYDFLGPKMEFSI